jgi:hypothetical protein
VVSNKEKMEQRAEKKVKVKNNTHSCKWRIFI